jgi:poly(beta-D-mannuronate) lyase
MLTEPAGLTADPGRGPIRPAGLARVDVDRPPLSNYEVNDRDAGLFDAGARIALLRKSDDPILRRARRAAADRLPNPVCDLPAVVHVGRIPRFYADRDGWREGTRELRAIEEGVTGLAEAFIASGDRQHADCLVDLLAMWAASDALTRFDYTPDQPQAWFQLEGNLFAIGLSYAIVRPFARDRGETTAAIDAWLARASRGHLAVDPDGHGWAWNNHYYRRALHAAAIGAVAGDDELFRYGVSALYRALAELASNGAFPRETARGARAVHYQNYALLYLIPIMELVARQGYPAWELAPEGLTVHDAVGHTLDLLGDPGQAVHHTPDEQDLSFMRESEYFAWMEVYLARFPDERVEAFVGPHRPVWNRSSVGAATLYFYEPNREAPSAR